MPRPRELAAAAAAVLLAAAPAWAKSNASTMRGWSSWSLSAVTGHPAYGREWLTAANVLAQSAALAASGLQGQGYVYVNVDSFWAGDPTQVVDEYGRWTPNATRFPGGPSAMRALADAVHARGQKFGLYLNPGVAVAAVKGRTPVLGGLGGCTAADIAWQPVSAGNTFGDCYRLNFSHPCTGAYIRSCADLLAVDWGVDFLKLDAVSPGSDQDGSGTYDNRADVAAWSAALEGTGRDVWLTVSWAIDPAYAADFVPVANAWRVADDVDCYCETLVEWESVHRIFNWSRPWLVHAGGGRARGFPDPDALNVGMGALDGLSEDEKLTYATLWSIICAPLYTGVDLTQLDAYGRWLLGGNAAVLSINAAGVAAVPTPASSDPDGPQVWTADYGNGTFIVALFNLSPSPARVTAQFSAFAGGRAGGSFTLSDVWYGTPLGSAVGSYTTAAALPPHGVQLVRMEEVGRAPSPPPPHPTTTTFFSPCAAVPGPAQLWNFSGTASTPGALSPLSNRSLCLSAPACSNASGVALVLAPCTSPAPPSCTQWAYDAFTFFTLTNGASGLLLTDGGAGHPAVVADADGSPAQAFALTGSTVQPADNADLCLTVGGSGVGG